MGFTTKQYGTICLLSVIILIKRQTAVKTQFPQKCDGEIKTLPALSLYDPAWNPPLCWIVRIVQRWPTFSFSFDVDANILNGFRWSNIRRSLMTTLLLCNSNVKFCLHLDSEESLTWFPFLWSCLESVQHLVLINDVFACFSTVGKMMSSQTEKRWQSRHGWQIPKLTSITVFNTSSEVVENELKSPSCFWLRAVTHFFLSLHWFLLLIHHRCSFSIHHNPGWTD